MTKKSCLITGTSGYIGQACAQFLSEKGWAVRQAGHSVPMESGARLALGDPIDPTLFNSIDALVHCAYDFKPVTHNEIERVNVQGSIKLFFAAKARGVSCLVFISTVSAFEGCRSLYGRGKLVVEKEVLRLGGCVIRPGLVWGGSERGMHGRLRQSAAKLILPVFGDGRQKLVLVHIEDLARCVEAALSLDLAPEQRLITAANAQPVTFAELLRSLAKAKGRKVRLLPVPISLSLGLLRAVESMGIYLSFRSDSLVSLLNPNPSFDFKTQESWKVSFRPYPL